MQIEIVGQDVDVDTFARDFIRTSVVFATWHHHEPLDRARVVIRSGRSGIRCSIGAASGHGAWLCETATAAGLEDAVQKACDRLEVALHREAVPRTSPASGLFAA